MLEEIESRGMVDSVALTAKNNIKCVTNREMKNDPQGTDIDEEQSESTAPQTKRYTKDHIGVCHTT